MTTLVTALTVFANGKSIAKSLGFALVESTMRVSRSRTPFETKTGAEPLSQSGTIKLLVWEEPFAYLITHSFVTGPRAAAHKKDRAAKAAGFRGVNEPLFRVKSSIRVLFAV